MMSSECCTLNGWHDLLTCVCFCFFLRNAVDGNKKLVAIYETRWLTDRYSPTYQTMVLDMNHSPGRGPKPWFCLIGCYRSGLVPGPCPSAGPGLVPGPSLWSLRKSYHKGLNTQSCRWSMNQSCSYPTSLFLFLPFPNADCWPAFLSTFIPSFHAAILSFCFVPHFPS